MKHVHLITYLFSIVSLTQLWAQSVTSPDTLEVQIGTTSKVLFLGHTALDWDEIANYDLNKLFEEIRLQKEIGLQEHQLAAHQAEKIVLKENLINRKLFGRLFYFNFRVGLLNTKKYIFNGPFNSYYDVNTQANINYFFNHSIILKKNTTFSLSLNTDFTILEDKRKLFVLKSGIDYSYLNLNINSIYSSVGLTNFYKPNVPSPDYMNFVDSLKIGFSSEIISNNGQKHILSLQLIPTQYFFQKDGSRSFQIGAGVSAGIDLSRFSYSPAINNKRTQTLTVFYQKRFQPAFHLLFGYRLIQVHFKYYPIANQIANYFDPNNNAHIGYNNFNQKERASLWDFGLKFGW